jgi:dTDP-4-dehydrorhamnose 3,5-epimerase-like enzyme
VVATSSPPPTSRAIHWETKKSKRKENVKEADLKVIREIEDKGFLQRNSSLSHIGTITTHVIKLDSIQFDLMIVVLGAIPLAVGLGWVGWLHFNQINK